VFEIVAGVASFDQLAVLDDLVADRARVIIPGDLGN
jgi:hypothetical protein